MPNRRSVLLVEDNERLLSTLTQVLVAANYRVEAVNNSKSACAQTITNFMYAVLDFQLPGINGIDLAYYLQKQNPEISIILITGISMTERIEELARNKWKILYKPFMASLLLKLLEGKDGPDHVKPAGFSKQERGPSA